MEPNQPPEGANNVGSEQTSNSEDGQIIRNEIQGLMAPIVQEDITGKKTQEMIQMMIIMKECFCKVVKEEIASAQEKLGIAGSWANAHGVAAPNERILHLKFLNEVSDEVLTGKEIKGKQGNLVRLAMVDDVTEQVVESGAASSARVEILVLEASDNEQNLNHEDFNSRIIAESDKTKPHFAKNCYVDLEKGIGELSNAKLAFGSKWTKICKCQLGAQVVENLSGIKVLEGLTNPFVVTDRRSQLYKKRHPPSLSDEVWRLNNIGRGGGPCKRLKECKVSTVKDFLFLLSVDPQKLKKEMRVSDSSWKAIVDHAQTCTIDDERIYEYKNVVFDAVGRPKGVIRDSQYVPKDHLSESDKEHAQELLRAAFEKQGDITIHEGDEMTFLHQLRVRAINNAAPNASTQDQLTNPGTYFQDNSSITPSGKANNSLMHQFPGQTSSAAVNDFQGQGGFPDSNPIILGNANWFDQTGASSSFQSSGPSFLPPGGANYTLVHQVPDPKSFASTSAPIQQVFHSVNPSTIVENANSFVPTGESSSLQTSYHAPNTIVPWSFTHDPAIPRNIIHGESTNPEYEKHGNPNLKDEEHRLENICNSPADSSDDVGKYFNDSTPPSLLDDTTQGQSDGLAAPKPNISQEPRVAGGGGGGGGGGGYLMRWDGRLYYKPRNFSHGYLENFRHGGSRGISEITRGISKLHMGQRPEKAKLYFNT